MSASAPRTRRSVELEEATIARMDSGGFRKNDSRKRKSRLPVPARAKMRSTKADGLRSPRSSRSRSRQALSRSESENVDRSRFFNTEYGSAGGVRRRSPTRRAVCPSRAATT